MLTARTLQRAARPAASTVTGCLKRWCRDAPQQSQGRHIKGLGREPGHGRGHVKIGWGAYAGYPDGVNIRQASARGLFHTLFILFPEELVGLAVRALFEDLHQVCGVNAVMAGYGRIEDFVEVGALVRDKGINFSRVFDSKLVEALGY